MHTQIRALLWGSLVLLMLPLALWCTGLAWTPTWISGAAPWLYGVTESAGTYGAAVTSMLWSAVLLWRWPRSRRAALVWLVGVALILALGQAVKTVIKHQVEAPRPHVQWLSAQQGLGTDPYYRLQRSERQHWLAQHNPALPAWLLAHWQHETDTAFPSGHSVFASSWALLAWVMLWPRRRYAALALITVWAVTAMGSRVVLGMHSAPDLAGATVLSALLVAAAVWWWQRLPARW